MSRFKLFFRPMRISTRVLMPAAFLLEISPIAGAYLLRWSGPLYQFLRRRGL